MPDILILPVDEAKALLYNNGIKVQVVHTRPVKGGQGSGALRVIRQRVITHDLHELVVAYEYYTLNN